MKKSSIVFLLSFFLSSAAFADADKWKGFYGSLSANAVQGKVTGDTPVLDEFGADKPKPSGSSLEMSFGYLKPLGANWLIGPEFSTSVGQVSDSKSVSSFGEGAPFGGNLNAQAEVSSMMALKLKLAYAKGNWMPYVEAGPVVAKTKYSGSLNLYDIEIDGPYGVSFQDQSSKFSSGWTAGFGTEYRVAKDIGFKFGYSYVNLGKKEYLNLGGLGDVGPEGSLGKKGFDLHIVKIGLTKYFN